MRKLLITIDGPAGAGKTTVSRAIADRLGYRYVDTGALYRGVAYTVWRRGIASEDDVGLERMLGGLKLNWITGPKGLRLMACGEDITDAIRTPEISMLASAVSARPVVRSFLLKIQRELGAEKAAVFEGRDMGTVVFPQADLKFFLIASESTRVQRRFAEISTQGSVSLEEVERDLRRRDDQDRHRAVAPLRAAPDAILVDSTELTMEEVVDRMLSHVKQIQDRF
jgi:cytidylate kinase